MGARTLVTFEQFEQFHDDGMKHELIEGEHIALPPAKLRHLEIQDRLVESLRPWVKARRLGKVHSEAGFKLSARSWIQPDVSFVRNAQIEATGKSDYYQGAPAIAIEIASESNTAAQLDQKMKLYFANGAEEVWHVFPRTKSIRVHAPDGTSRTVASGDLQSSVLPGWAVAVDSLFEA